MKGQISLLDGSRKFKVDKPVRLIELFAGIGSQAKALSRLGWDYEHHAISEWETSAVKSYKAIHCTENNKDYSKALTKEQLTEKLFNLCISADGKEPMTYGQIKRKPEHWQRETYNNFKATNNIGSIVKAKGADLKITDTDKYIYIMTYSFPCQDLSKAGKGAGMAKDSGTRSGLLWEVERLLTETEKLPQVLLMENVPDVIGTKNIKHFAKWVEFLEKVLGYKCYWDCLNAKNYGIPQNRDRCFMVSVLGDYYYHFPKPLPLVRNFYLDKDNEEKIERMYYINNPKTIKTINKELGTWSKINPYIAITQTSRQMASWRGNFIRDKGGLRFSTPEELFLNMGFEKKDATLCRRIGVPNSQLYKQAGNSIVVNVLEAIFKELE